MNAPLETRSPQRRGERVYRPALQAGGGEEESPVRAEAHLEPPGHLAELSQDPPTSHLPPPHRPQALRVGPDGSSVAPRVPLPHPSHF